MITGPAKQATPDNAMDMISPGRGTQSGAPGSGIAHGDNVEVVMTWERGRHLRATRPQSPAITLCL